MSGAHSPQRTCLGCRKVHDRQLMLRMVCSPTNEVVADIHQKLPGRGVYVCYNNSCIHRATDKGLLSRGFKKELEGPGAEQLIKDVKALLFSQLLNVFGLIRKSGQVEIGYSKVFDTLGQKKYALLVLAEDMSQPRVEKLQAKARSIGVEYVQFATKELLGHSVGKEESGALGIFPGGLAEKFKQTFSQYRQLSGEY